MALPKGRNVGRKPRGGTAATGRYELKIVDERAALADGETLADLVCSSVECEIKRRARHSAAPGDRPSSHSFQLPKIGQHFGIGTATTDLDSEEETLAKIGNAWGGLSRERIRQIQSGAFAKLRRSLLSLR